MVARPFQNTVVIEWLGSNKSTVSTYLPDESQSTTRAKEHCQTGGVERVRWERKIWRGLARKVERRECCSEDLLEQRREELVQGVGDLPDGDAAPREHPWLHRRRQQRRG